MGKKRKVHLVHKEKFFFGNINRNYEIRKLHKSTESKMSFAKGVFLQLRNEFEFPAKIIFTNISTGISVTAISYLW